MPATTTEPILDAVRDLTPSIAARAEETERTRCLPTDLVDDLLAAGCFRMLVPRSHGGAELDLPVQMQVLEELARADASVAWNVMIGSEGPVLFRMLPRASFDALYAAGPDVIMAAVAAKPTGTATPVDGGYRVSGRWAFASGCQHAHWFVGHCVVDDSREPPLRMMALPRSDYDIKDTWSVSGLCGTGSHDVMTDGALVPDELSFALGGEPSVDVPPLRIPEVTRAAIQLACVTIGVAQGALAEILALAVDKTPAFAGERLAASPLFQYQFGEAEAQLRAARAALHAEADIVWAKALARAPLTPEDRAHVRGATTWVARTAATIVTTAYQAGGSSSIHTSNPLQRRLRDANALTQHLTMKADTFTKVGAVLAGQDVDLTIF